MTGGLIANLLAQGVAHHGVAHLLRTVRKHLGMDVAFITHFRERDRVFEHVDSDGTAPIVDGQTLPLEDGYCWRIVRGELPELISDTSLVPAAMALSATRELPIGAHLSVPIELADGKVYGTLCCFSYLPKHDLCGRDMQLLRALGEAVALRIDENLKELRSHERAAAEIASAMALGAPRMLYQPIYSLSDDSCTGVECLSRFDCEPRRPPDAWFSAAWTAGLGLELESRAIRNALCALDLLPSSMSLSINSSPELILSGCLGDVLSGVEHARIVVEITEHAPVADYGGLSLALAPLRAKGVRLAVDDAGAGYASMRHILNLKADVIKLDISLTRNIDVDPGRRALAKGLIAFAHDVHSTVTAEGVETVAELEALHALGVDKVQGYFLSRPQALDHVMVFVNNVSPSSVRCVN